MPQKETFAEQLQQAERFALLDNLLMVLMSFTLKFRSFKSIGAMFAVLMCGDFFNASVSSAASLLLLLNTPWLRNIAGLYQDGEQEEWPAVYALYFSTNMLTKILASLHKLPGFKNHLIIKKEEFATHTAATDIYVNYDNGFTTLMALHAVNEGAFKPLNSAGLVKLAVPTVLGLTLLSCCLGTTKFEFDMKNNFIPWFFNNAFIVCPSEEVLFRGLIQGGLSSAVGATPALLTASMLFGLAHQAAGAKFATLAGLAYGMAFARYGLLTSIALHLLFNVAYFTTSTYPKLKVEMSVSEACSSFFSSVAEGAQNLQQQLSHRLGFSA